MQRRQSWMRDELIEQGQSALSFIGSLTRHVRIESAAGRILKTLKLSEEWASKCPTWEDALVVLRESAEDAGIFVATNSRVGLSNRRTLDPEEFRGFVLCDAYAPLIFVNGADTKSARMFTMAHELAHLWLGYSGLFNLIHMQPNSDAREKYCNRVAAELMVPRKHLITRWEEACDTENPFTAVARWFKVSPLVVARRALDLDLIGKAAFFVFYKQQQEEWQQLKAKEKRKEGGPNFYTVQNARLGRRFAYAVVCAAREGRLPYRDAYQLTGLKGNTFDEYANRLTERMGGG